jgi:hypothetical protein
LVFWSLAGASIAGLAVLAGAHDNEPDRANAPKRIAAPGAGLVQSAPGQNEWNRGRTPEDWWGEMLRYHGHVGPWNVVGWRIGQAALREFGAGWGDHSLDVIVHLPLTTPYTCLADGLAVGAGNSIGRLDIRLVEELSSATVHVSIRSKTHGRVLEFWPSRAYLRRISGKPVSELGAFAKESATMPERDLFEIRRPGIID